MISLKKVAAFALTAGCLVLAGATVDAHAARTRTVTDLTGKKVRIPTHVKRVADLWHANNQVVLLLGGQQKLVATTPLIKHQPWFKRVDPGITKIVAPFAGQEIQVETLIKTHPDVVIAADPAQVKVARQAKLPTVNASYQDFAGLKKSVNLTAAVLGGSAPAVAKQYTQLLNHNINLVQKNLTGVKSRPTVLHIVSATDLTKVDGTKTIVNEWIRIAGGKNAVTKEGNQITVTSEEIVKANPAVIIVGQATTSQARAVVRKDATLRHLPAVKHNRVYGNPTGTFPWDRYSAEEALQVLWAAKLLHSQAMKDVNLVQETKHFYKTFYHYNLTTKQAQQILAGK